MGDRDQRWPGLLVALTEARDPRVHALEDACRSLTPLLSDLGARGAVIVIAPDGDLRTAIVTSRLISDPDELDALIAVRRAVDSLVEARARAREAAAAAGRNPKT